MQAVDFLPILQWWFYIFVIGIGFLPLTVRLFHSFIDKGYIFTKILGIIILSYCVFVLGTAHILPFSRIAVFAILLPLFAIIYFFFVKNTAQLTLRHGIFFLIEEVLFLLGLVFWSYIRTYAPDIHGLEKFMDFGFINSILRSTYFPPKDMWLTPETINYYYFGHFIAAVLTKLSAIPPAISYNIMLATVFSFCLTGTFSIAANLIATIKKSLFVSPVRILISGILSAALVTFSGNLHILYAFFTAYPNDKPVPFWELAFQPLTFPNGYWYPNATRFIHNTIHEFPMYSWVVADLHGHVLDIAFVITTIAILLAFFFSVTDTKKTLHSRHSIAEKLYLPFWKKHRMYLLITGFLLAIMYMTNAWDGMIYFLLASLVIFTIMVLQSSQRNGFQKLREAIFHSFIPIGSLFVGFILFSLPFSFHFNPASIVSGIGVLCAPEMLTDIGKIGPFLFEKDHCQKSPLWQLGILYGFFYFFIISFLIFLTRTKKIVRSDIFVLLLIILATLLINIPEFFYVKDIYPDHYRANTMFKLVFQAFIMLSLVSGYVIMRFAGFFREKHISLLSKIGLGLWMIITWILLSLVLTYPFLATNSYYGDLKTRKNLNGIEYLKTLHPDDFDAITWINRSLTGQPVMLEAQGDSYTDYARISANTGLPTVLGWTVHEWLWRGSYDVPAPRIAEIEILYESDDLNQTADLLRKYAIEYVYIGNLEREKYDTINETKWVNFGTVVFQKNNTMIYKIDPSKL